ncbi:MAG: carbohydrate-binding protein [Patescibacteria group bacterium]|nr:carbohydrate-binding protein [Patescibacteria group bacterium]
MTRKVTTFQVFFNILLSVLFLPAIAGAATVSDLESRIAELLQQFQALQSELDAAKNTTQTSSPLPVTPTPSPQKTTPSFTPFNTFLHKGSEGPEVANLQRFLAQYPDIYPEAVISGYYGDLTESAVKRFQRTYEIVSTGAPTVTGYGLLGIRTRAKLNELNEQNAAKAKAVVASTPPSTTVPPSVASGTLSSPSQFLRKGSEGAEVTKLQQYLAKDPALYPEGTISGYFGVLTEAAIKRFQQKYGIVSAGTPESTGYGMVGPKTRAKLNELMGGDTTTTTPSQTTTPNANNTTPSIQITAKTTASLSESVSFTAQTADDGRPFGTLTITWSKIDGPGTVTFSNTRTANTAVSFSETGRYHIKATVSDGVLSAGDTIAIDITSASTPTDPATTTPPTSTPTLTFSATPTSITKGATVMLTWVSTNVSTCTASSGWSGSKAASGSATLSPTQTTTYILSCAGTGGNTVAKEVVVTVTAATTNSQTPYSGTAISLPGTIQAEHFDKDGEGIAYHDTSTANNGGAFRTTEGVDIQTTEDSTGSYDVGWTEGGEWLEYSVNVTTAGTYVLDARVASNGAGGTFHVEMDDTDITGSMTVPDTGDWQSWTTITSPSFSLTAGSHILRLAMETSSAVTQSIANFNFLTIRVPGSAPAPTLTLSANPTNVSSGSQSTLTWSTTNATSCTASGGWSGTKATNSTSSITPDQTTTYTLACTGTGGSVTKSVTVSVATTPPSNQNGLERSGRWFTYDGQPTYLVGFDAQQLATDPAIDYVEALDLMAQNQINKVRIWTYVWFGNPSGAFTPWVRDANGRHDLDQWNPAYWDRVRDFLAKARDRKIVVEISIFAPYPAADWWWPDSDKQVAWNKDFNTNGAFSTNSSGHFQPEFFDLNYDELSTSGKTLKDYQQALVDKVVTEFGGYKNAYFEVMNEFGTYGLDVGTWYPWQLNWSRRLDATSSRQVAVYTGGGGESWRPDLYQDESSIDVLTIRSLGSPQQISDMLHSIQLKGKAISLNETTGDFRVDLETHMRYAWGMFMSGGHVGLYDGPNQVGDAGWIAGAERLKALRTVAEAANFSTLSPVDSGGNEYDSLVSDGPGSDWQVMANPGSTYLAYFWGNKSNTSVKINISSGNYSYTWYDARDAEVLGSGSVSGGTNVSISAPPSSTWNGTAGLVLVVKK